MSIEPVHIGDGATLYCGDCLDVLPTLDAVTAVVTDPPYGLSFMGKKWDYDVPTVELWREVLRALTPGGHLLSFAGTRTQHRMAVNIEDAGFVIRDMIAWVYGSGFPKSLDLGKATEAEQWHGYGTALKPALEPITVATKPLEGTFAQNAMEHGVGGLNVDGCRVGTEAIRLNSYQSHGKEGATAYGGTHAGESYQSRESQGRWPANLIHDGSEEVVGEFPETGPSKAAMRGLQSSNRHGGYGDFGSNIKNGTNTVRGHNDNGGTAARFFYCAKSSRAERGNGNSHPTVKPLALMKYLVKLVSMPEHNLILDPFMGSGTTALACLSLGVPFIGIERDPKYFDIARERIQAELAKEPLLAGSP